MADRDIHVLVYCETDSEVIVLEALGRASKGIYNS